jgi:hypothetical protein
VTDDEKMTLILRVGSVMCYAIGMTLTFVCLKNMLRGTL